MPNRAKSKKRIAGKPGRNPTKRSANTLRLIGGSLRRRQLQFPEAEGLRPTGDRVRETLFNWLQDYSTGASCLDLYAGSGALGIEAISRGAAWLDLVDCNPAVVAAIRDNLDKLEIDNARVSLARAENWLAGNPDRKYQLVFLDPPFAGAALPEICRLLEGSPVLDDESLVYVECDKPVSASALPDNWQEYKARKAGQVYYYLYKRTTGN